MDKATRALPLLLAALILALAVPAGAQTSARVATDLALSTAVDNPAPTEGDQVVYTISLTNDGRGAATNVQVDHVLPRGMTLVSSAATRGVHVGSTGVWALDAVAGGATETLTVTAIVDRGTGGSTIVDDARIATVDQIDRNTGNDSARAQLTVRKAEGTAAAAPGSGGPVFQAGTADVAVSKTVDNASPAEGGTITYTVVLTNNGPDAANNIQVDDLLPAGVTFVSSTVTQGIYLSSTGIWVLSAVANGASDTLTLTATVDSGTAGSTITNTATFVASDETDPNAANDSDFADIVVKGAELSLAKLVNDPTPNEGDTINYTVVLTNNGPDAGTNVQVNDLLPGGVTFVSSSTTQGTYVSGTGVWSVASIAAGVSDTLTINASVDAGTNGTTITNSAAVTASDQLDGTTANNSASVGITVQRVDLAITKTVDAPLPNEGDTINYTVVVANSGPDAATNVQVTDVLPAGVTFVSSSATQGSYVGGTGLWTVGGVANAGSATLTITATVDAGANGATITNIAAVTGSDQADSNPANDSDSVNIDVQSVDLALTKTVDDASPSEGGTVNYTVVVSNGGPDGATSVQVTDVLPAGVTFVSSSATQGAYVSGTGVWTVGSVANAASATLTLTATVDAATGGTTITNSASITGSDQADGNAANDSDSVGIAVQGADLAVTKTVDDSFPNEGGTVNYTVVVANNGPDATTNVQITDVLPAGVTFASSFASQGTYVSGTGVWTVGTVANAASATLTITATVDAGTGASTIVNAASVTASDQPDNTPANDSDSASLTVQSIDLTLVKTVSDPFPNEGASIDYTIVVSNGGPDAATNIQVTDALPAGVTFVSSSATQGSYVSGTGVWSVGTVASAGSATLTLTATVDTGTNGSTITNTASVTASDQADSNPADDGDSVAITVQSVDLAVTKTVDDANPNEGGTVNYTVVLTNNGPDAATNVQLTDVLPAGVTFLSSSATQGSYSSGTGIWSAGSIANAASATLTLTATVDAGTNGQTITNTASFTSADQTDSNPANDSDSVGIVVQAIDLAVTKTVNDTFPNEGGTVSYTVVLANNGPDTATNIQITDVLPAGMTFVSSTTTQGTYIPGTGAWTVGSLASAASETLTINASVDAGTNGTTIVNTASVTAADQQDTNAANDSDSASLTVQSVDLAITKTVDQPIPNEGTTVTYTVVLDNNGPDTATNVQVTDLLPAGVTFVSDVATQGTYVSGTGVWSVGTLANLGSATLTLTATVDAGTGGQTITNTASVTGSDQADGTPANDSDSAGITVQNVDLAVTKTVDNATPNEGATINYTVVLANNGPSDATNVQLDDLLPAGVTFVSSSATQGTYVSGTGVWSVGGILNGATATLTLTATVDAGTNGQTITNTATVTASDQVDTNAANDTDSAALTVQSVDLGITKTVDNATPNEGGTVNYTIVLSNAGPDAATSVQVTDLLPGGVTFVSSSATQGTYSSGTGNWTVGSVASAGSATLTLTATVDAGTNGMTLVNTASVTGSDQADSNPANDSDAASLTVQSVDLAVAKTVDNPSPNEGDTVNYTVTLSNNGPDTATSVQLTDVLPVGVTFVSSSTTQGVYSSGTGVWTVGSVANAASATLTLTTTVDATTNGQTIVNAATVTGSDQADSNPANDTGSASLTVQSVDLAITKTVDDPAPTEGGTVNYTVVVSNGGPDAATAVLVADLLPAGVTFVSSSATQGTYSSGTGVWSVGSVANAASATLTLTATVDAGTGGTTITNTASYTGSDQADSNPANDSDSAIIDIQEADLAVTKTVDNANPNEGTTINYTVVLANNGPDTAAGVLLTDVLPAGVTFVSSSATQGFYDDVTGVWTVGSVANAASVTLTITASVDAGTNGQTITNTAAVTASDQVDNNPANDSDSVDIVVQGVDLAVTKTVDDSFPNEGGTISYTVVLTNNGPDAASNIQVTDVLPAGVTFSSSSATQGAYVSGTGVWTLASVAAAVSDTLTITATVDAGTNGTTVVNTASITGSDQADNNPANDSDSASLTVQSVDLSVTKTVDNNFPNEGATIQYTIVLANSGPDAATNITLADALPAGVTFLSSTATQGFYTSGTGLWTVASISAAASETLTITATVDAGTNGSTIVNTGAVSSLDQADSNPANDSDSVSLTVQSVDLSVAKVVDNSAPSEGGTINYTIVLTNNGPDTATNIQVTDVLPAGVTFASSAATQGFYVSGTGIWVVSSIANAASETLVITATVDAGSGGTSITNAVAITGSDQTDSNAANDSDSVNIAVQEADLAVSKTVDDAAPAEGGTINYTVAVTNNGPDGTTNVQLTDLLPSGVTFVSSSATQGAYVSGTGVWTLAALANGASDTLTVTATVDLGTGAATITNTASVTASDQPDNGPADDSASVSITVQGADLAIVKTVDNGTPSEGATINYTVTLTNGGPDTATNIQVNDLVPTGVTFASSAVTQGIYISSTGTWIVASVASGAQDTLTITATVDGGTNGSTITNTAAVAVSDQADGNAANNTDSVDIVVTGALGAADLAVVKTVDNSAPAEGATINYTVALSNNGPDQANNVQVTDLLPGGVTLVSSSATQGTYTSGTGIWTVGSVANAATATLTITATVDAGTGGTTITNTASVTASDQTDSNAANDTDSAGITVLSAGGELQITTAVTDARPSWSPDGLQLTFDSNRSGNRDVWTVSSSGGTATQITTGTDTDRHPDWSPDTTQIVFGSNPGGGLTDLYLIPASGGTPVLLDTDVANDDKFPDWSPDGTQIAYEKGGDIYTIASTGGTPVQITTNAATDVHPTWSPDGLQIAFASNRSGNNDIWVIPATGGTATQVTTNSANDSAPDWSPDGTQFAFQSNRSGNNDIWVIPAVGGATTQITTDPGNDAQPDWSPNGNQIAFARINVGLFIFSFPSASADLVVAKTVDIPSPNEGDTVNYTVTLSNNGPALATNVQVTDLLPAGVTFVSASATQGTYTSGTGVWNVGSANGTPLVLTLTATVDAGTGGQTITNTASVSAVDQSDPISGNDSASVAITVQSVDLAVIKTVDNGSPLEADTINYTVELTNNGPFTAIGVEVTDTLPAGVTFVSSVASQGTYSDLTGIWTVGNMVATNVDTLTITATVDAGTAGSTITNTATITASSQTDINPANDTDSVGITVLSGGGGELQITTAVTDARPSWSPDGLQLTFDSNRSGNRDVWTVSSSGGTATQITTGTDTDRHPDWSPDTTQIVFGSNPGGGLTDLYLIPASGGTPVLLDTDVANDDKFPDWSPDGTQIAYQKGGDIYTIASTGGTPVQITTDVATDVHPTWSPDGLQIAFASNRSGNNDIWVIPASGGTATQVTTNSSNDSAPDWSPDGTQFAFQSNRSGNNDIWVIPAAGGTATQITTDPGNDAQPDWSPDGSKIAFARINVGLFVFSFPPAASADLAVLKTVDNPAPGEGVTIVYTVALSNNGPGQADNVQVTDVLPAGVTFVSSSATQGTYTSGTGVWSLVSIANAASDTLTITATVDAGTGGTTITNTAAVTASDQTDGNAVNDSDSASITVLSAGGEVQITTFLSDNRPSWSPDGIQLTFDSNRSGNRDIWTVSSSGGTATQLTTGTDTDQHPNWSPDTTQIVFSSNPGGGLTDLYLIPAVGGTAVVLDTDAANDDKFANWSPDGTQIAYQKGGDIYVIASTGGTPVQLTTDSLATDVQPTWSPDGLQIAFGSDRSGNNDIWIIPASGGTATQVTTDTANDSSPDWSPDGTQFTFVSNRAGNNDIWLVPVGGGAATQITTDPGNDVQPDWSPDGSQIAFARINVGLFVFSFGTLTADLGLTKTVDLPSAGEGATVSYTVALTNSGPALATNVQVTDLLPTGVTFVSASATQGAYVSGTGVWSVASIASAASDTLTITATVDAGTTGQTITNTASITASDLTDFNATNDTASADVVVTGGAVDAPELTFVPKSYALDLGRPNPFRQTTMIPFNLPRQGMTTLTIWDVTGRRVKTVVQEELAPGRYQPVWEGRDDTGRLVSAGIYFVRLRSGSFVATQKVIRLR